MVADCPLKEYATAYPADKGRSRISGIMANIFSWHTKGNDYHPGVQIDLLIDRADNVKSAYAEMKYAPDGYEMTSKAYDNLKTQNERCRTIYARKKKSYHQLL